MSPWKRKESWCFGFGFSFALLCFAFFCFEVGILLFWEEVSMFSLGQNLSFCLNMHNRQAQTGVFAHYNRTMTFFALFFCAITFVARLMV